MTSFDVYLFTRLDSLNFVFVLCAVLAIIAFVVSLIIWLVSTMDNETEICEFTRKLTIISGICFGIFLMVSALVPTTKEAAAIYLLPKIANNEQVQAVPDKAMKILNGKLDQWLEDLRGKEKK